MTEFVTHRRYSSVDQEDEMCHKLIQMSFAKIVNSKHERGGAKLHKNLLILHLLQKARTEHRRSGDTSPPEMVLQQLADSENVDDGDRENNENSPEEIQMGIEATENYEDLTETVETTELLSEEFSVTVTTEEIAHQNVGDFRQDSESSILRPPLLRFVSMDDEQGDEITIEVSSLDFPPPAATSDGRDLEIIGLDDDRSDEILAAETRDEDVSQPRVIVQSHADFFSGVPPLAAVPTEIAEEYRPQNPTPPSEVSVIPPPASDLKRPTFTILSAKSKKHSKSMDSGCSSGSNSPTSSSESGDSDDSSGGDSDDSSLAVSPPRRSEVNFSAAATENDGTPPRRRKRKHRSPSFAETDGAAQRTVKKSCVETTEDKNGQISGLISVFQNTGLEQNGINDDCSSNTTLDGNANKITAATFESLNKFGADFSKKSDGDSSDTFSISACRVSTAASVAENTTCGALSVSPPRSISCPSFVELTCRS